MNACHKSTKCPKCNATVIVWKRGGIKANLLRLLAVADHLKVAHGLRV